MSVIKKSLFSIVSLCFCFTSLEGLLNETYQQIEDYHALAQVMNWSDYLHSLVIKKTEVESLKLLDIGCGTGRWLTAFQNKLTNEWPIELRCDLIDPSLTALQQAKQTCSPPLFPNHLIQKTIQQTELLSSHYDIIWAMHSFYSIPEKDLSTVLKKCIVSLNDEGELMIGLTSHHSFYIQFYNFFRSVYSIDQLETYTDAEMIQNAFQMLGLKTNLKIIHYVEKISANDIQRLSHYLLNECVGYSFDRDNSTTAEITISDILNNPKIAAFLNSYLIDENYEFPQELWLLSYSNH
jgi:ubiquinone/menaquinone biosynthesis C-methylase UbiE